jgi:mannose-6-phosphate isomerase-like protein (cupin superfamily)
VEGEARLVIGGKSMVYRKGDCYFIPEGVVHSAITLAKVNEIAIFDDPKRFRIKEQIEK